MSFFAAAVCIALFASSALAECLSPDEILPDLAAGNDIFVARDVDLPEMAFLGVVALSSNEPDEQGVHLWPKKHGDEVAKRHLCSHVSLRPIGRAMDYYRPQYAVALSTGVDYRDAYPMAHDRLQALGQLVTMPRGRYRVVRFPGRPPRVDDPVYQIAARAAERCSGHIAKGSKTLVFPLC